jgi:type II secretory pathway component PulF
MFEDSFGHNVAFFVAILVPFAFWSAFVYAVYLTLRAPLRRQGRACLFLDLLESGIREGSSPEQTIVEVADSGDRIFGRHFQKVAKHLRQGMRLGKALEDVPGFLPSRVVATLQAGEQTNNFTAILEACRKTLTAGLSRSMKIVNYMIVLFLVLSPAALGIPTFIAVVILPKFREITEDYGGALPPMFNFFYEHRLLVIGVQVAVLLVVCAACATYGRTLWLLRWLDPIVKPMADRLTWKFSWRRKQLLRDFSIMLAILLDANLPESKAIQLAAASTDNTIFIRLGEAIVQKLQQGVPLTDAMAVLDDGGEFRWRLTNAIHGQSGFQAALGGWHEALDAKAFQQEQAASQVITTVLVILNGAFVGMIAIGVFQALMSIVWEVSLW